MGASAENRGELGDRGAFTALQPVEEGAIVDTRWALTRAKVGEDKNVMARFVATRYQNPDWKDGSFETPVRVSIRPSRIQVILMGPLKNRRTWIVGTQNAFLQLYGFRRDAFLRALAEWNPDGKTQRMA